MLLDQTRCQVPVPTLLHFVRKAIPAGEGLQTTAYSRRATDNLVQGLRCLCTKLYAAAARIAIQRGVENFSGHTETTKAAQKAPVW